MTNGTSSEKETFLSEAESYIEQGLYQKAQDFAQNWLDKFPGDAEARMILCHAWTRMGKLDRVKQLLKEVDEAISAMSLIYARMGDVCRSSGLNQEAIAFYRKFVNLNPDSPLAIDVTAKLDALLPSGVENNALPQEEDEASENTMPGMQTVTMAELYAGQGHKDLAMTILKTILGKDVENRRASALLAKLQDEADAPDAPKTHYKKSEIVINKLTRWLNNLDRIGGHAA